MFRALRTLRQMNLDRQRRLAIGVAHLDEFNRTYPDGAYCDLGDRLIQHVAAWEELFAKPEWAKAKASHLGRCSCCGSIVDLDETTCGGCGAVWREPNDHEKFVRQLSFGAAAIIISTAIGYFSGELFVYAATDLGGKSPIANVWHDEFINFVESYIWISVAILSVLASTYAYEKSGLAPKGVWTPAADPVRPPVPPITPEQAG